jgi:hypothetical protein
MQLGNPVSFTAANKEQKVSEAQELAKKTAGAQVVTVDETSHTIVVEEKKGPFERLPGAPLRDHMLANLGLDDFQVQAFAPELETRIIHGLKWDGSKLRGYGDDDFARAVVHIMTRDPIALSPAEKGIAAQYELTRENLQVFSQNAGAELLDALLTGWVTRDELSDAEALCEQLAKTKTLRSAADVVVKKNPDSAKSIAKSLQVALASAQAQKDNPGLTKLLFTMRASLRNTP